MEQVTVSKDELLGILRQNRAEHAGIYERAVEGFRRQAVPEMERNLEQARSGGEVVLHVQLDEPEEHLDDYDAAIRMLELHQEASVTISSRRFRELVMNEWMWQQAFTISNSRYLR